MPDDVTELLAEEIWQARGNGRLDRLTDVAIDTLSIERAYDVQDRFVAKQLARPDAIAGWKVGCTSSAVRAQFGLEQPVAARIFSAQVHESPARLAASTFVDCAVEAEIVLLIQDGQPAALAVGLELHHYRFFHGRPTSQELVAGNALQAGVVLGPFVSLADVGSLDDIRTDVVVNGELAATGVTSDIMDAGPGISLAWLHAHLARRGEVLADNALVLPGSAVPLIAVRAGDDVQARATLMAGTLAADLTLT